MDLEVWQSNGPRGLKAGNPMDLKVDRNLLEEVF